MSFPSPSISGLRLRAFYSLNIVCVPVPTEPRACPEYFDSAQHRLGRRGSKCDMGLLRMFFVETQNFASLRHIPPVAVLTPES